MKKITLLLFLVGTSFWVKAQVLNQNAGWPNPAWTLTGSYLAIGIQSDPTSTSNFAFNDDATGSGHEDNIAAESPVINLTPAFNAGEKWLTVSAQYVYRYLANDELVFQYWNADTSSWVNWGTNFDALGNYTTNTNYCSGTPSTYTSVVLNISGFTPTQLSGFKYRISYDDDPAGADWNYGFCFQSPTIVSSTPPACPNPTSQAAVVTSTSALLSWTENGSASLYNVEYGANGFTQGTGTLINGVSNSYNLTPLTPSTSYSYYVQASCGVSGTSAWVGPFNFTTLVAPPVNDNCAGAITVTCGSSTAGTTTNSTNESMAVCGISGVTTQNTPGVWYKYTGDGSDVTVTTCSSTITTGDSRIAVYSGSCGALTCIGGNDDAQASGCASNTLSSIVTFSTVTGTDYYILVYAYLSTSLNFELNVNCVAACTPASGNDECSTATQVTIGNPITGANNTCSSASLGTTYPTCGNQFGTYYDTWYWFDSGSVTNINISLTNQTGTAGFALYSGTCGALTLVTGSCTTTGASTSVSGLTPGTYYLRVFSPSPITRGSYDLSITSTLGTGSFDNGSFSYYPNPVKNILNLSYNQEISNVEVFNLVGQKVSSNTINANEAQINMSNLSNGAYMVKVTSNNQVKTIKVMKQ